MTRTMISSMPSIGAGSDCSTEREGLLLVQARHLHDELHDTPTR